MKLYLYLILFALFSVVAHAEPPVVWNGTTARWLPSGLKTAGVCTTSSSGVQSVYTTNGILKLTSGTLSAAAAGTDYQAPISLASFGSSPNSNGATFSSNTLTLQPADATNPGGVSTTTQTIAGAKTFSSLVTAQASFQANVGNTATPGFYIPTGGGNAGLYFGASGLTFAYNGGDIASLAASSFRFNTQVNHFFNSTAGTPSIIFQEANSGIYRIAANNLGVSISSTKILDIASTGLGVTGTLSSSGTATLANIIDSGLTADTVPYANSSKQLTSSAVTPTELGYVSGVTSSIQTQLNAKGSGSVTTLSVTSANGFAGSVANATTTPAITLSTTITGLLKGNGTAISAASAGTDYAAAPTGSANTPLFNNGSGGFTNGTRHGNTTEVATVTGSTTTNNCAKWDANGNIVDAGAACGTGGGTTSSDDNMIYVDSGNGHGATNTTVRRYLQVRRKTGYVTYADSSNNGGSFTVATGGAGAWFMCVTERRSGAQALTGITVNGSALSTNINAISYAQGLRALFFVGTNSETADGCTVDILADGDVVRVQDSGSENATNSLSSFMMVRLGAATSQVTLSNGNGYGATNTMIRNYTNQSKSIGSDITGARNSTNGASLTANSSGMYVVCRGDGGSSSGIDMGISLNSSAKTTDIFSLTYAQGKRSYLNNPTATGIRSQCFAAPLSTNDVIYAQDDGTANDTNVYSYITMVKIDDGVTTDHIFLDTGGGAGSLQTKKYYLTTKETSTGTGASYDNSSLNGTTYTINDPGIYMTCLISWVDSGSFYSSVEVGQNPAYTTNVSTPLEYVNGVRNIHIAGASNSGAQSCFAQYLDRGQTYSFHSDGGTPRAVDSTISFLTRIK